MSRENSPVSGSDDQSLRRLGEQVRRALQDDDFLSRMKPGKIISCATGSLHSLSWSTMNRVLMTGNGTLQLPPIEPAWIGKPLYVSKQTGTGIATVIGAGQPRARVDSSATGVQLSTAGLRAFMTDGSAWYSEATAAATSVSSSPSVGTGIGEIQLHDLTYNPILLLQFQNLLTDSSGNGFDVAVDAGQAEFATITQRLQGIRFNGLRLVGPNATLLAQRGDMTVEFMAAFEDAGPVGSLFSPPLAIQTGIAISYTGGADDTGSGVNYLYQLGFPDVRRVQWFSEHGVGVNDVYNPSGLTLPLPGNPFHLAASRINSRVQFYLNGKPYGTLSPSMFAPTDGIQSRLWLGGTAGTGPFTTGNGFTIASMKVVATGLDATAIRGEYNRTLGPFLGTFNG